MKDKEIVFQINGSGIRFIIWVLSISLFYLFNYFLICLLIENWDHQSYILIILILPISIMTILATFRVSELFVFLIKGKPLIQIQNEKLNINFDHGLKIDIDDIIIIEIKATVGVFRPPIELLIKTKNNKNNSPYQSNKLNIVSFRSRKNSILIDPIFYKGNRKKVVKKLCENLKAIKHDIKIVDNDSKLI